MARPKKVTAIANNLIKLHQVSVVIFVALAVVAALVMRASPQQLRVTHVGRDELASSTQTVFAPASRLLLDVSLRTVLIVFLLLAAVSSVLALTYFKDRYRQWLGSRMTPFTWIVLGGVLPALMVEIAALLSGVQDVMVLKLLAGLTLLSGILGFYTENLTRRNRRPEWLSYWLALAAGALPWLLIGASAVFTPLFGMVRLPWYVYAVYAVLLTGSIVALWNLARELRGQGKWRNFAWSERNYLLINLVVKTTFALVLILGLRK